MSSEIEFDFVFLSIVTISWLALVSWAIWGLQGSVIQLQDMKLKELEDRIKSLSATNPTPTGRKDEG